VSTLIRGTELRTITQGILVHRDAALPVDDGALFDISGGRIILLGFLGHVTVAIKNESLDFGIVHDPDNGGSNVDLAESTTGVAVDADAAGTMYTLPADPTNTLVIGTNSTGAGSMLVPGGKVLGPGTIELTIVGTVTGTADRVEWDLLYVPLDEGASVAAA
jgi:hypothetical protein